MQFEDFGNTIYERINGEVQDKITLELSKSLLVLQDSINTDFSTLLNESLKSIDLRILTLEGQCEDLKAAQDQGVADLGKYQDNIERIVKQS